MTAGARGGTLELKEVRSPYASEAGRFPCGRGDSGLVLEILFLAIPVFFAFASLVAAGVIALVALFRGERSLFLALPLLLGGLALLFLIGELASPH